MDKEEQVFILIPLISGQECFSDCNEDVPFF